MIENESYRTTPSSGTSGLDFRAPKAEDGRDVYEAVRSWGGLDLNSPYAYLLACDRFAAQCCVAERDGQLVGFLVGLASPQASDTLFVWQVGVSPALRGQRLAGRLIDSILGRDPRRYAFVEAHVGPNNQSSMRLFEGVARQHDTRFEVRDHYPASWFPAGHDAEQLVRVGPLRVATDDAVGSGAAPNHQE
jgi:diaminobutyrate acetyltransferase